MNFEASMFTVRDLLQYLFIAVLVLNTLGCEGSSDPDDDDDPPIDTTKVLDDLCFQRDVLPILRSSCSTSGCHDAGTAAHEIVLDSWESIMMGDEDLVTPFDPRESDLYKVLVEDEDDERMPPPPMASLTERQIGIIRQWIQEGALNEECSPAPCDTIEVTWPSVRLILQDNCWGCHSNAVAGAGIRALEDYEDVVEEIRDGDLIPSIERTGFLLDRQDQGVARPRLSSVGRYWAIHEGHDGTMNMNSSYNARNCLALRALCTYIHAPAVGRTAANRGQFSE